MTEEIKPLTHEGLFAYFDQMTDADGNITTTSEWLADVGMLIVHEVEKQRPQWKRISVDGLPKFNCRCLVTRQEITYVAIFHDGEWFHEVNRSQIDEVVAWTPLPEYTGEV